MSLEIIQDTIAFESLREEWDALTTEPLRSFDWHFAWWTIYGEASQLRVYVWRQQGKLVGIAPFFIDSWLGQKRLRYLASGEACSDYAQVIVAPEYQDAFVLAIANDVRQLPSIQLIELDGILTSNEGSTLDAELCGQDFWSYEKELEPTWVLEMPESWTSFVSSTKKSLRRKVKNAEKRIANGDIVVRSTNDGMQFDTAFDILVDLHQERFIGKGKPGAFADQKFLAFLKLATAKLASTRKAEILIGYHDQEPVVAQLYLHGSDGPQMYQSGVSNQAMKLEPGHLLFTFAVKRAIETQAKIFDFLRGSEPYKPYWGAIPRPLAQRRCVSKKIVPSVINHAYYWLRAAKHAVIKPSVLQTAE